MEELSEIVKEFVMNAGSVAVGIVTNKTLEGGPPSTDLTYVLPNARSAICFALPLNQDSIECYLKKKDYRAHNLDNAQTNTRASGIAFDLAKFLEMKGYKSVAVASNFVYRKDTPRGLYDELPDISHRYLAVRSGIGHFGLSGNVIRNKEGAAIILGSVVTEAELTPTDPLPKDDNYCDNCRMCQVSCASEFMSPDKTVIVSLGDVEFSYSKRRTYLRCDYVCGGFSGLHRSGKWSTWSPARFRIPENDEDFRSAIKTAAKPYRQRKWMGNVFFHPLMPGNRGSFTCGHCQLVCHPDKEVRKRRYKMIASNGVVIQFSDGSLKAVTREEAKKYLETMDSETRKLYEDI